MGNIISMQTENRRFDFGLQVISIVKYRKGWKLYVTVKNNTASRLRVHVSYCNKYVRGACP